ncbi:Metallo-dependent phosphatase-like protein [Chaetomidium leptoderma]|uniref:Metallo-dependent phosphatase-like protein n=1 Tax=Chaetomidium leptoderma TaxID=669021 RepID=A0AAN6VTH7_9PEZI|nr:Metallo-dependent phosphatase-like protein [Chaetomidium leptoderma]
MTRRIVRTIVQTTTAAVLTFIVIFFLDRNFRVLPNALHEYLPMHHAGTVVTDITLAKCSTLNVFSSCSLDPVLWHRIDKDLYLRKGVFASAYLHVQRKREQDLAPEDSVVIDVSVGRLHPDVAAGKSKGGGGGGDGKNGRRAGGEGKAGEERWEARPGGLWIKRSNKRGVSDSKMAVTAVDVLFGDDAVEARPGWAIMGTPLLLDSGSGIPAAQVTIRRGAEQEPHKPVPRVMDNGRFKIVQLADLHLSTGVGQCRDAVPEDWNGGKCEADPRTLDFVVKVLEEEKPNLVVLSGDQVNGETAPDAQTAIFKYAQLLINLKIPYVSIFGNHDDEGSMTRAAQMDLIETLPYSLSKAGPVEIDGVGNYYIEILGRGSSDHSAITVYLLDTHSYSPNERKFKGYDWIKKNQIDWFRDTAQGLKKKHKEYTHHHMNVAFIHIPIPEYTLPNLTLVGEWKEPSTAPQYNSGFYDALVEEGVLMVSCGHDHVNEHCGLSPTEDGLPALWMCHAGAAGFGGYAGYGGFHRKIRVFDFDMNEARIRTWKRVEYGPDVDRKIEELMIVDRGRVVAPMQEE